MSKWSKRGVAATLVGVPALAFAAGAQAEPRTITVTLFGGATVQIVVDVPPGTPLDQVTLPPLSTPVVGVTHSGPATPAPAPPSGPAPASAPPQAPKKAAARKPQAKKAATRRQTTQAARVARRAKLRKDPKPAIDLAVAPTGAEPTFSYALPGAAIVGVPNFFIDKFRIPPFLLPIYQAAGIQYGVRWEILAAINEIETDYGRNLSISTAGAEGWMQFMPATWKTFGSDANGDGKTDPYNPVDAIFSAARYLRHEGAQTNIKKAIFAYNHADWYVDSVLMRARLIGGAPADLIGSLTGLTEGRFPVAAESTYVKGSSKGLNIYTRAGARVVAVQDAKVVRRGRTWLKIRDAYGNTYTYANLAKVAQRRTVRAGTVIGRVGTATTFGDPHVRFEIRPVGKGTPRIDPKPILDGWKLLEATSIYRLKGKNALLTKDPSIGQVLLMSKDQLATRVLDDRRIRISPGGIADIRAGRIDRRVLATLEFLAASGLNPTVSCLQTGHGLMTASGNISEHSSGNAVDISAINGIPIAGHQGAGSITDATNRALLTLQGTVRPHQIISLMTYEGADNTLALPDHADHIHVGFRPEVSTVLKPLQWTRLVDRIAEIDNPVLQSAD